MKRLLAVAIALAGFAPAWAEDEILTTKAPDGAILRGLDTANGDLLDIEIKPGETVTFERLTISLSECRYPTENPAADAFAHIVIQDVREDAPRFEGWMIASSPALSALDHPRYDVWVLRCKIPAPETEVGN